MNESFIIQNIVINRKNLIEIIIVAVLLAFGVNLITGNLQASTNLSPFNSIMVGIVLCLCSVLYLTSSLLGKHVENRNYKAFFIYNKKKNEIVPVPRYEFSESIHTNMRGAFIENPAIKTIWEKVPLGDDSTYEKAKSNRQSSDQLLSESIEYFVLNNLSTHLKDYFSGGSFEEVNLKQFYRKDIPDILLSNRFLEMFSRPMEDRSAFVEETFPDPENEDIETVAAYDPNGYTYEKFDLVLPKGSTIQRLGDNEIKIDTTKMKISIGIQFCGFGTNLPEGFEQYYLGIDNLLFDFTVYKVEVDIRVLIKFWALFTVVGLKYHHWIDSFLEKLEKEISQDAFFERIGWEHAYTIFQCFDREKTKEVNDEEDEYIINQ